jgi:heptosyltransferase II
MIADSAPRTLVVQALPGIGDALWNLPACRAIAAESPGGRVVLAAPARTQSRQLFAAEPWNGGVIDLVRGMAGAWQLARALRRRRFERGFVLHHSPSLGFALWAGGVRERAGFGLGLQRPWLNRGVPIDARAAGHHARLAAFLAAQGIAPVAAQPPLALPPESRARIAARFGNRPRPWLVVAIGASEAFKRWPEERFAAVIDRLDPTAWPTILLAGGPQDEPAGRRILDAVARDGVAPVFDLPLADAGALIAGSTLLLGNDSGLLNLAVAVQCRCIGLFGATPALAHGAHLTAIAPLEAMAEGMAAIGVDAVLAAIAASAR